MFGEVKEALSAGSLIKTKFRSSSDHLFRKHHNKHVFTSLFKASKTLSLDLCPPASPQWTRPQNGNHLKITSVSHFSPFFKCEMKPASSKL